MAKRSKTDLPPLEEAVVEWLEGERLGVSRSQLVAEIDRLARHCRLWPVATKPEWETAIELVVQQGFVAEQNGVLRVAESVTEEKIESTQLELF